MLAGAPLVRGPNVRPFVEVRTLNSTNYYYGIVNPTGGNPSDGDWTRLTACQTRRVSDLAPTVAYSPGHPKVDSIRHLSLA